MKERLWGGEKLHTLLNKPGNATNTGESWELSGVPGDVSVVAQGTYKGKSLANLIAAYPEELLGPGVLSRFGREFPILIKFIDAQKDLSIQLHPGDELAQKRHNSFGKTEMWYIMEAEPGAELIIGFNRDTNRKAYEQALKTGQLTDLLHYEPVKEGDTFFINSGKIHAIGAGILLAEIQQSSDVTYRVYDFDRKDASGNLRELHTELALDAIDFDKREDFRVHYPSQSNLPNPMVESRYFNTTFWDLRAPETRSYPDANAFHVYLCVGGDARFTLGGNSIFIQRGETVLIPAAARELYISASNCQLLEVTL